MKKNTAFLLFLSVLAIACHYRVNAANTGQDVYDLQKATVKTASETGKSVVSISSVIRVEDSFEDSSFGEFDDYFSRFFEEFFAGAPERELKRTGLGSGIIIDKDGYILTNEHVVLGATEIKVKLPDGREFDAQVKGTDKRADLAVIKINVSGLPAAKLGDSDNISVGSWVMAVGNPFGFAIENPEPTVTVGVVSANHRYVPALGRRDRIYDDMVQTDAAINPGNSGGPLVNLNGEVIGINTAIITTSGGYQGLGFAIPVNKAKKIISRLIKGEKILYGWLGVSVQDLNDDLRSYFGIKGKAGVLVVKVYKDSPADAYGIKEDDIILDYNNNPVKNINDLMRAVSSSREGETVGIKIIRAGKEKTANVKISGKPEETEKNNEEKIEQPGNVAAEEEDFRGIKVSDITPAYRKKFAIKEDYGAVVISVKPESSADKSGVTPGDVILRLGNNNIKNKNDFILAAGEAAAATKPGRILLKTNRGFFILK